MREVTGKLVITTWVGTESPDWQGRYFGRNATLVTRHCVTAEEAAEYVEFFANQNPHIQRDKIHGTWTRVEHIML